MKSAKIFYSYIADITRLSKHNCLGNLALSLRHVLLAVPGVLSFYTLKVANAFRLAENYFFQVEKTLTWLQEAGHLVYTIYVS